MNNNPIVLATTNDTGHCVVLKNSYTHRVGIVPLDFKLSALV